MFISQKINNFLLKSYCYLLMFGNNKSGVTTVEYAIVTAGVVTVMLIIFSNEGPVGLALKSIFNASSSQILALINKAF